jgi:hypothetical protein
MADPGNYFELNKLYNCFTNREFHQAKITAGIQNVSDYSEAICMPLTSPKSDLDS